MATKPKTLKYSYGELKLTETSSGDLKLEVNIEQADRTPEQVLDRIRATLCGLQYVLNNNESEIQGLGEAFIEGMETGIRAMQSGRVGSTLKSDDKDKPTMGFHAP